MASIKLASGGVINLVVGKPAFVNLWLTEPRLYAVSAAQRIWGEQVDMDFADPVRLALSSWHNTTISERQAERQLQIGALGSSIKSIALATPLDVNLIGGKPEDLADILRILTGSVDMVEASQAPTPEVQQMYDDMMKIVSVLEDTQIGKRETSSQGAAFDALVKELLILGEESWCEDVVSRAGKMVERTYASSRELEVSKSTFVPNFMRPVGKGKVSMRQMCMSNDMIDLLLMDYGDPEIAKAFGTHKTPVNLGASVEEDMIDPASKGIVFENIVRKGKADVFMDYFEEVLDGRDLEWYTNDTIESFMARQFDEYGISVDDIYHSKSLGDFRDSSEANRLIAEQIISAYVDSDHGHDTGEYDEEVQKLSGKTSGYITPSLSKYFVKIVDKENPEQAMAYRRPDGSLMRCKVATKKNIVGARRYVDVHVKDIQYRSKGEDSKPKTDAVKKKMMLKAVSSLVYEAGNIVIVPDVEMANLPGVEMNLLSLHGKPLVFKSQWGPERGKEHGVYADMHREMKGNFHGPKHMSGLSAFWMDVKRKVIASTYDPTEVNVIVVDPMIPRNATLKRMSVESSEEVSQNRGYHLVKSPPLGDRLPECHAIRQGPHYCVYILLAHARLYRRYTEELELDEGPIIDAVKESLVYTYYCALLMASEWHGSSTKGGKGKTGAGAGKTNWLRYLTGWDNDTKVKLPSVCYNTRKEQTMKNYTPMTTWFPDDEEFNTDPFEVADAAYTEGIRRAKDQLGKSGAMTKKIIGEEDKLPWFEKENVNRGITRTKNNIMLMSQRCVSSAIDAIYLTLGFTGRSRVFPFLEESFGLVIDTQVGGIRKTPFEGLPDQLSTILGANGNRILTVRGLNTNHAVQDRLEWRTYRDVAQLTHAHDICGVHTIPFTVPRNDAEWAARLETLIKACIATNKKEGPKFSEAAIRGLLEEGGITGDGKPSVYSQFENASDAVMNLLQRNPCVGYRESDGLAIPSLMTSSIRRGFKNGFYGTQDPYYLKYVSIYKKGWADVMAEINARPYSTQRLLRSVSRIETNMSSGGLVLKGQIDRMKVAPHKTKDSEAVVKLRMGSKAATFPMLLALDTPTVKVSETGVEEVVEKEETMPTMLKEAKPISVGSRLAPDRHKRIVQVVGAEAIIPTVPVKEGLKAKHKHDPVMAYVAEDGHDPEHEIGKAVSGFWPELKRSVFLVWFAGIVIDFDASEFDQSQEYSMGELEQVADEYLEESISSSTFAEGWGISLKKMIVQLLANLKNSTQIFRDNGYQLEIETIGLPTGTVITTGSNSETSGAVLAMLAIIVRIFTVEGSSDVLPHGFEFEFGELSEHNKRVLDLIFNDYDAEWVTEEDAARAYGDDIWRFFKTRPEWAPLIMKLTEYMMRRVSMDYSADGPKPGKMILFLQRMFKGGLMRAKRLSATAKEKTGSEDARGWFSNQVSNARILGGKSLHPTYLMALTEAGRFDAGFGDTGHMGPELLSEEVSSLVVGNNNGGIVEKKMFGSLFGASSTPKEKQETERDLGKVILNSGDAWRYSNRSTDREINMKDVMEKATNKLYDKEALDRSSGAQERLIKSLNAKNTAGLVIGLDGKKDAAVEAKQRRNGELIAHVERAALTDAVSNGLANGIGVMALKDPIIGKSVRRKKFADKGLVDEESTGWKKVKLDRLTKHQEVIKYPKNDVVYSLSVNTDSWVRLDHIEYAVVDGVEDRTMGVPHFRHKLPTGQILVKRATWHPHAYETLGMSLFLSAFANSRSGIGVGSSEIHKYNPQDRNDISSTMVLKNLIVISKMYENKANPMFREDVVNYLETVNIGQRITQIYEEHDRWEILYEATKTVKDYSRLPDSMKDVDIEAASDFIFAGQQQNRDMEVARMCLSAMSFWPQRFTGLSMCELGMGDLKTSGKTSVVGSEGYQGVADGNSLPEIRMSMKKSGKVKDGDDLVEWPLDRDWVKTKKMKPYRDMEDMHGAHLASIKQHLDRNPSDVVLFNPGPDMVKTYNESIDGGVSAIFAPGDAQLKKNMDSRIREREDEDGFQPDVLGELKEYVRKYRSQAMKSGIQLIRSAKDIKKGMRLVLGPSGVGKTHYVRSAGSYFPYSSAKEMAIEHIRVQRRFMIDNPATLVLYRPSEEFLESYVTTMKVRFMVIEPVAKTRKSVEEVRRMSQVYRDLAEKNDITVVATCSALPPEARYALVAPGVDFQTFIKSFKDGDQDSNEGELICYYCKIEVTPRDGVSR